MADKTFPTETNKHSWMRKADALLKIAIQYFLFKIRPMHD